MTTIAFDGKQLVADTRSTIGKMNTLSAAEKIMLPGVGSTWKVRGEPVLAVGIAGNSMARYLFADMLVEDLSHRTPTPRGIGSFSAIIVTGKNRAYRFSYSPKGEEGPGIQISPMDHKGSIGSGGTLANAVMSIDLDAVMAVRAASNIDPHTGGDLRVWSVDEPHIISTVSKETWEKV